MYCPKCGIENADESHFCKECGMDFDSLVTRGEFSCSQSGCSDFDEALYESFEAQGTALLDTPKRLLALTTDISAQDTAELRVFEHNCDQELLAPFSQVVSGVVDESSLDDAAQRAALVLRDRYVDEGVAGRTAWGIRNAIARTVGVSESEPPVQTDVESVDTPQEYDKKVRHGRALKKTRASPAVATRESSEDVREEPKGLSSDSRGAPSSGGANVSSPVQAAPPYASTAPYGMTHRGGSAYAAPAPQRNAHAGLVALLVVLIIAIGVTAYMLFGSSVLAPTASISFKGGNGTTGTMETVEVDKGMRVMLPACGFEFEGYHFDSWIDEDGVEYRPGDVVDISKDMMYWAQWVKGEDKSGASVASAAPVVATPVVGS